MFETMAAFVLQEHLAQESFDPPVGTVGDKRLLNPHNKPLQTSDGWISVTINTDPQVRAFLKAVGRDHLLEDERFATVAARAKNVKEWFKVRGAALSDKTTAEWLTMFRAADIAAMPCHTLSTLRDDPHLAEVGLISSEEHPTEGKISVIRSTIRDQDGYPSPGGYAQPKGWETRQILEEIGLDSQEIDLMVSSGAAVGPA
jgi:crotonobetainyl-CoA:carnitine CoA-transferase CaiB-like acyl-CoA transferase